MKSLVSNCFVVFFIIYTLIVSHIIFPTTELLIPGLSNPQNLICLLFSSILISFAFYKCKKFKELTTTPLFSKIITIIITISIPTFYHIFKNNNLSIMPFIGLIIIGLFLFSLIQINLSTNKKLLLLFSIVLSGFIESLICVYQTSIFSTNNSILNYDGLFGSFIDREAFSTYVITSSLLGLFILDKHKKYNTGIIIIINISLIFTILSLSLLRDFSGLLILSCCLTVNLIAQRHNFINLSQNESLWAKTSCCALTLVSIWAVYNIHNNNIDIINSTSTDEIIHAVSSNPLLGSGFDTYKHELLNYFMQLNQNSSPTTNLYNFDLNVNFILQTLTEAGVLGLIIVIYLLILCMKIFTHKTFSLEKKLINISLFAPIVFFCIIDNPLDHAYIITFVTSFIFFFIYVEQENNIFIYPIKSTKWIGRSTWLLPLITGYFVISGLYSLPIIHKYMETNDHINLPNKYFLNKLVRLNDINQYEAIENAKLSLKTYIPGITIESWKNLKKEEKYAVDISYYQTLTDLNKLMIKFENKENIEETIDFQVEEKKSQAMLDFIKQNQVNKK